VCQWRDPARFFVSPPSPLPPVSIQAALTPLNGIPFTSIQKSVHISVEKFQVSV
jgi:hypothetical protein